LITFLMMSTMYGHPFSGHHPGCEPQPKSHKMADDRMKLHSSVCLASV